MNIGHGQAGALVRGIALVGTLTLGACRSASTQQPPPTVPGIVIAVVPRNATLPSSATLQFDSAISGADDTTVTWSVIDCGAISPTGLYTAPGDASTCHVLATSHADPTKSDLAIVDVVAVGGGGAWRPFGASSPWNTPISAGAPLDADSAGLVARFASSSSYGPHLDVNIAAFSIPLYWANSSTPESPVIADVGGEGWDGSPAALPMPIPVEAEPDPQSDHHMLVIDRSRGLEWGCWNIVSQSGRWHAGLCATADISGTGVRVPAPLAGARWWLAHGARACGFPLVAGLIRVEEIQAGRIDHALVIGYPGIQRGHFTPPASTPSAAGTTNGVPCGGRFQYDPSIDVSKLGLSRSGQIIVRALQEYGAYVGDYSGSLSLYAENSGEAQAYWATGVLNTYELQGKIDLASLRVLQASLVY